MCSGSAPDNNRDLLHYLYAVPCVTRSLLPLWAGWLGNYNVFTESGLVWHQHLGTSHTSSRNFSILCCGCCRSCTDDVLVLKGATETATTQGVDSTPSSPETRLESMGSEF